MRIEIRVQPKSSMEEIKKTGEKSYKIYMHEPAENGKANRKLIEMLAGYFGSKKNKVRIIRGLTSRNKLVEVGTKCQK